MEKTTNEAETSNFSNIIKSKLLPALINHTWSVQKLGWGTTVRRTLLARCFENFGSLFASD